MKKTLLLVFLLIISFANAQDSLYNYRTLDLDMTLSSDLEITGNSNSDLDYLKVQLYLYPESGETQEVLSLLTVPNYQEKNDYLELVWAENRLGIYEYTLNSKIKTYNQFPIISKKIPFPIQSIDSKYSIYLQNTEKIDSNQDIINKASELAEGEDDLYRVVFKLAEWTKQNIKYNLTTLTAEASEPSSWVLKNKYGVCDELTNLFISFCRSLGIPARFVSGLSYTNSDIFETNWGLHGWAEVYFPDYGWISFDPTYAQFGYSDATHIKLSDSIDSDKSSTKFEWLGNDVSLKPGETDLDVEVIGYGKKVENLLDIEIIPLSSVVGLESFNLIEAKIKNLKNYYVSTELLFSSTKEVELHDSREKYILIEPNGERSVYWIVGLKDLKKNYIYTFPIEIFDSFGYSGKSSFQAKERGVSYTLTQIGKILQNIEEQETKTYSKNLELDCDYPITVFFNESFEIACQLKNKGNVILNDLRICLEKECKRESLGITQSKNISFFYNPQKIGETELTISAKNIDVTKSAQIRVIVEDKPQISIQNINYPDILNYGPEFDISFELHKKSLSNPKNAGIKFVFNNKETKWHLDEIDSIQKFNIQLDKSMLNSKDNNFQIIIEFYDKDNNLYFETFEKNLPIEELNTWQKIIIWISKFSRDLEKLVS